MSTARTSVLLVLLVSSLSSCAACALLEPELGGYCAANTELVNERIDQVPGQNSLGESVHFEDCEAALCTSTNGSRPYCTKPCSSALDCQGAPGETWRCQEVVRFGRLACDDWSEETDCLESTQPTRYCVTTRQTIEERDEAYGREWPSPDVDVDPDDPDAGVAVDGG